MVKLSDLQRIMGSSLVLETAGGFIFGFVLMFNIHPNLENYPPGN